MSKKTDKQLTSVTNRHDDVTLSQIDWLTRFCTELGLPSVTKRMVVARAVEFYTEYAEDILLSFQCRPKDPEVRLEIRALMDATKHRVSPFGSAELPEQVGDRLTSYSEMVRSTLLSKRKKLPGVYIPKGKLKTINKIIRERETQETNQPKE